MIKTGVIVSNPFQENTIVLSDSTGECIIVDAGGYTPQENAALSKYIEQNGLRPVMAVNTHGLSLIHIWWVCGNISTG